MRKTHKKKTYNQMNHLSEKKCIINPDRLPELGGVNKLYRAARRYGVERS